MSIGLGIFLSSLIFAAVGLYLTTRDRWDWFRVGRWIAIGAGSLALLAFVGSGMMWGYQKIVNLPTRQTTYADLTLGMTMQEVKYVKGVPGMVNQTMKPWAPVATSELRTNQRIENYLTWIYASDPNTLEDGTIAAYFSEKTRRLTEVRCYSESYFRCPSVFGLHDGSTEKDVIDTLGQPNVQRIEDSGIKDLTYSSLDLLFRLQQKKVFSLTIYDSH